MLIDEIKKRMFAAIKANNTVEKELFRTAVGEVTRTGEEATDERMIAVLKKMLKSAEETLGLVSDADQQATLKQELALLQTFLPKSMSLEDLKQALAPVAEAVRSAGNDGQATGIAMKHVKAQGLEVEGKLVTEAVKALRA
jgi:uncharacterized protein